jgi:ubiquinol-cytochrome c reductase cytochrome b subunit
MITAIVNWIDERIRIRSVWGVITDRPIPGGASWFYVLGATLLFIFILQMLSGIFLALYYVPTPDHAYASVKYIQNEAFLGSLVRGMHHWGASFMMVLIALHVLRVFVFGSYKKPRELVWLLGLGLIGIVFGFAFTGYLLPWDQKAYWATVVGTNVAGTVPVAGGLLVKIMRGGAELGSLTLSRFYAIHTHILPWSLALLAGLHIFILELAGPGGSWDPARNAPDRTEPLFPHQIFRDSIMILIAFLAIAALAAVFQQGLSPRPIPRTRPTTPAGMVLLLCSSCFASSKDPTKWSALLCCRRSWACCHASSVLDRSPERAGKRKALMALAAAAWSGSPASRSWAPWPRGPGAVGYLAVCLADRLLYEKNGCSACHSIHAKAGPSAI